MTADPLPNPPPEYREREPEVDSRLRRRFLVWVAAVIAILIVSPTWLAAFWRFQSDLILKTGAVVMTGLTSLIAFLIATTPRGAIRLPPLRSVGYLIAATTWLVVADFLLRDLRPPPVRPPGASPLLIVAAGMLSIALVYRNVTPWWTAVAAWNPLAVGPVALWSDVVAGIIGLIAVIVLVVPASRRPV